MDQAKGKDHSEYCWSCGRHAMAPDDKGYHCTVCGATWIDIQKPHESVLTYGEGGSYGQIVSKPRGADWGNLKAKSVRQRK